MASRPARQEGVEPGPQPYLSSRLASFTISSPSIFSSSHRSRLRSLRGTRMPQNSTGTSPGDSEALLDVADALAAAAWAWVFPTSGSQPVSGLERFVDEAGEDGAHGEVVDLAKRVEADASSPVDGNQARSAPQLVPAHRDGQGAPGIVGIDADGEGNAVLVQETLRVTRGSLRRGVRTRSGDRAG